MEKNLYTKVKLIKECEQREVWLAKVNDNKAQKVVINSGLQSSNTIAVGVACGTNYGSYWLGMSLSNTTNIYNINKLRANVSMLRRNVASISILSGNSSTNSLNYSLPQGGYIWMRYALAYHPYEDIPLTYASAAAAGTTNHSTFKIVDGSATKISAKTLGARFGFQIENIVVDATAKEATTIPVQKQKVTSGNRCFGFGSSASSSATLSFTIEGKLAALEGNFVTTDFKYIVPVTATPLNQISVQFLKPVANTDCVFTLICTASTDLSPYLVV